MFLYIPTVTSAQENTATPFTRALQRGSTGEDVRRLQEFLSQFPGIYPDKSATGFFGSGTKEAVRRFQTAHGLEPTGVFGTRTRAMINDMLVSPSATITVASPDTPVAPTQSSPQTDSSSFLSTLLAKVEALTDENASIRRSIGLMNRINNLSGTTLSNVAVAGISGITLADIPLIDLASKVTGVLAVSSGGTGLTSAPAYGQIPVGNSAGGYTLTATSSLGLGGSLSGTINSGVLNQLAYYASNGTTLSGIATSSLGINTDNIIQGITNLFYSNALVQSFIHASTTIPKTYTANTFTGANTFSGTFTIGSLGGPLQANAGIVSATTSIGVVYGGTGLTSAPTYGQIPVGNSSGGYTLTATSSLGLLGTGASLSAANTWTALQQFSAGASTTQHSVFSKAYFGGTATSTFDSAGILTLISPLLVGSGGTGWSTINSGAVLYGNGSSALSTTTVGSAGQVLALLGGIPTWTATSTLSNIAGTLGVTQGGTGLTSAGSAGNILRSDGTNFVSTAVTTSQSTPGDPTATTTTTGGMMGLAGSITPVRSGTILIIISGDIDNNTAGDGAQVQIRYGTGSAPANGNALTGTAVGGLIKVVNVNVSLLTVGKTPFSTNAIVTGLTPNTAYWIDAGVAAITGGTARIRDVSISAVEL